MDRKTDGRMDRQDERYHKAFKKFITKFAKLRNSNKNTVIRHFHNLGVERKVKRERLHIVTTR